MSKTGVCRKIPALLLGIFSLCLATQARGQELTGTLASESVKAGDGVSMWLNALNTSGNEILWTFPTRIESEMISAQGTFDGLLALHPEETNAVMIAPGAFVRREYLSTVPDAVAGWKRGLQLSALGQMGSGANYESVQLDLTYPTMRFFGSFSLYLDVQYFDGYGESLLGYNQRTDELRLGFALFR
jgi:hypothetical protein